MKEEFKDADHNYQQDDTSKEDKQTHEEKQI